MRLFYWLESKCLEKTQVRTCWFTSHSCIHKDSADTGDDFLLLFICIILWMIIYMYMYSLLSVYIPVALTSLVLIVVCMYKCVCVYVPFFKESSCIEHVQIYMCTIENSGDISYNFQVPVLTPSKCFWTFKVIILTWVCTFGKKCRSTFWSTSPHSCM